MSDNDVIQKNKNIKTISLDEIENFNYNKDRNKNTDSDIADENVNKNGSDDYNDDNSDEKSSRRDFVVMAASAVACVGAAVAAVPFIRSMGPDASVLASGTTEVDITNIKEGETITTMWRGNPIFITHRTPKQIQEAKDVNLADLRDPELDSARVKDNHEKWLITIAVCTHLGCVPQPNKGIYDGFLCPCHGSQYDSSARIRQGPAPKNLPIPPYQFISDTKILIG